MAQKLRWHKNQDDILTITETDPEFMSVDIVDLHEVNVRDLYLFIRDNYDTNWWESL